MYMYMYMIKTASTNYDQLTYHSRNNLVLKHKTDKICYIIIFTLNSLFNMLIATILYDNSFFQLFYLARKVTEEFC